jgi:hypothetical protein
MTAQPSQGRNWFDHRSGAGRIDRPALRAGVVPDPTAWQLREITQRPDWRGVCVDRSPFAIPGGDTMETTERNSQGDRSSSQRTTKDLQARGEQGVKGGARSDIGQKLQFQLNEANSIYAR